MNFKNKRPKTSRPKGKGGPLSQKYARKGMSRTNTRMLGGRSKFNPYDLNDVADIDKFIEKWRKG